MAGEQDLADWRHQALAVEQAVGHAVVGQSDLIRLINIALFARGHVLLEGDVGVGKTTLLRAFARAIGGAFERVEGTVDLLPGDLIYHTFVDASGNPRIEPGPLLRHESSLTVFFFNEINRARPQAQSLLLRAMAEKSVTAFNREFRFPHMTVFADRNKVEKEETFELPSAARDRFMFELSMSTPTDEAIRRQLLFDTRYIDADALIDTVPPGTIRWAELNMIGQRIQQAVVASEAMQHYALQVWQATQDPARFGIQLSGVDIHRLILAGASPRGMMAMLRAARVLAWLDERDYLVPDDIRRVMPGTLAHRIFLQPVYELRREQIAGPLVDEIIRRVAAP